MKNKELFDETLRDGIQSYNAKRFNIDNKKKYVKLIDIIGIESINLGFFNSSKKQNKEIIDLINYICTENLTVKPAVVVRLNDKDINECITSLNQFRNEIYIYTYIAISDVRIYAENWNQLYIKNCITHFLTNIIEHCNQNIKFCLVFEDSTRANPIFLNELIEMVNYSKITSIVLADTVGCADINQVSELVSKVRSKLKNTIMLEWHGHNDMGLALCNALVAMENGASKVHACFLGLGERCGNTSMEQLLIQLNKNNKYSINKITNVCQLLSDNLKIYIPKNYPLVGKEAFFTCAGTHASSIYKSYKIGGEYEMIFSPFNPDLLNRTIEIGVNKSSGISNIKYINEKYELNMTIDEMNVLLDMIKNNDLFFYESEFVNYVKKGF